LGYCLVEGTVPIASRANRFLAFDCMVAWQQKGTRDLEERQIIKISSRTEQNRIKENIIEQTTRKENNWKTEEALARAAVTLETERIKGSSP